MISREEPLELFPGEQIVYEKKNGTMHKRTLENVADYSGWKTNSLYFTDTRLDHISKELSRKFNKEIVLMDPSLERLHIHNIFQQHAIRFNIGRSDPHLSGQV